MPDHSRWIHRRHLHRTGERGNGISRLLLRHAEEWCRTNGCREIATDAELDNEKAQQFHRRMGFVETYRIVEFRKSLGLPEG